MNSNRFENNRILRLVTAAMCLALCMVLPLLTGQIPEIGSMLCPMHLPVLLCGYLCGPLWAGMIGFAAPLVRFVIFGMPPLMPTGIAMAFELAAYGAVAGLMYRLLPKKTVCLKRAERLLKQLRGIRVSVLRQFAPQRDINVL